MFCNTDLEQYDRRYCLSYYGEPKNLTWMYFIPFVCHISVQTPSAVFWDGMARKLGQAYEEGSDEN
jgi:hypothetical protein